MVGYSTLAFATSPVFDRRGERLGGGGHQFVGLADHITLVVLDALPDLSIITDLDGLPVTVKSPRMPSPTMPGLHAVL